MKDWAQHEKHTAIGKIPNDYKIKKITDKELTIRQIGEFCTNTLCKKCPVAKWNEESGLHNDCMESLRFPEVSRIMLEQIKGRKEMGRLIDDGLVLDNLSGRLESMKDYDAVKDVINNMPTAYYPDKVVEQLEDYLFEKYCVEGDSKIERIVKGGGVDG